MEELISVIVPVYNGEQFIEECLNSIINQSYNNLEIIIINDGSIDKTLEICNKISKNDSRIVIYSNENHGVSYSRNFGIEKSNGKWLTFVDADDYLEIDFCELMLKTAIEKNVSLVNSGLKKVIGDNLELINFDEQIKVITSNEMINNIFNVQSCYGFVHTKLIKKSIIKDVRFDENLAVVEDALFNIELMSNLDKICLFNKPLYNYRINSNSVVHKFDSNYPQKYYDSLKLIKQNVLDNNLDINNFYNFVSYHIILIANNYCFNKENKKQIKLIKEVCDMELYKDSLKRCNYNGLSLTRKVALFTLKHKLYFFTKVICFVKQMKRK